MLDGKSERSQWERAPHGAEFLIRLSSSPTVGSGRSNTLQLPSLLMDYSHNIPPNIYQFARKVLRDLWWVLSCRIMVVSGMKTGSHCLAGNEGRNSAPQEARTGMKGGRDI